MNAAAHAPSAVARRRRARAGRAQAPPILHLSQVVGSPLRDADGRAARQGRRPDRPPRRRRLPADHRAARRRSPGGRSFLGVERVSEIGADGVVLRKAKLDLRHFERRPDEVLLEARPARPPADQRRGRAARARQRDRARARRGLLARRGRRHRAARRAAPAAAQAARRAHRDRASSSTGPASSRSSGTSRRCACACPTRSSRSSTRRRSPTSSRRPRATRARRSSRPSATTTASSRPTSSRSSTTTTSASSSRTAPTSRSPRSSRGWRPTTPPTSLGELDEERREPVLALLPVSHRVKVRALLGYDPAEAGGLMSPDFVLLRRLEHRRAGARGGPPQPRSRPSC